MRRKRTSSVPAELTVFILIGWHRSVASKSAVCRFCRLIPNVVLRAAKPLLFLLLLLPIRCSSFGHWHRRHVNVLDVVHTTVTGCCSGSSGCYMWWTQYYYHNRTLQWWHRWSIVAFLMATKATTTAPMRILCGWMGHGGSHRCSRTYSNIRPIDATR